MYASPSQSIGPVVETDALRSPVFPSPGGSLACPPLPPDHLGPGSFGPHFGDNGPSDSAQAAASGCRLRRSAADRQAAHCASQDLYSHGAPRCYPPSKVTQPFRTVCQIRAL